MMEHVALPLSILIRTLNEADRLPRTLKALEGLGNEVVVIDSGSTDGTREVAAAHGARVIEHNWGGFGPQRSFGEAQCTHDWVFYIDADETPTPELKREIQALLESGAPPHAAYEIRNTIVLPGDERPRPFADVRRVTRLTNRRHARVTLDPTWDRVELDPESTLGVLEGRQWHYSFRSWSHAIAKIPYTSRLAAETQAEKPVWQLKVRLVTEIPLEFLKFYLIRGFVFGGWKGFAFSVVQAFARFARILQMLERRAP